MSVIANGWILDLQNISSGIMWLTSAEAGPLSMEQLVVVGLRMEEEEEEVGAKTQEKESIWKGFSIQ